MKRLEIGMLAVVMLVVFTGMAFAEDPVTITIWDFKYGDAVSGMQAAMQKVDEIIMRDNPNIKIDHVGQTHDNYYQILRAAVMAGEGPDIVMFHGGNRAYEFDEYTLALDDYIAPWREEISEFSWGFCSEGGDGANPVHLIPITIQGLGMYYNKAKFVEAGLDPENPPADLDEFLKACEQLKQAGIVPITGGVQGVPYTFNFFITSFISNIYGPESEGLLTGEQMFTDNAAFRRAIEVIQELVDKEYLDPNIASIPYFMDAPNLFAAGNGAMFIGLLSDVAHWKVFNDSLGKDAVGYFPAINLPESAYKDQQVGQPAGIGYSIMKWSKHPDEAMKVLEGYARGEGAATWMGMTGAFAPNKKIDVEKLGYPLVAELITRPHNLMFTAMLAQGEREELDRHMTELFIGKEITIDKFIELAQEAMDNSRAE